MKRIIPFLLLLAACGGEAPPSDEPQVDLLIAGGTVLTMDAAFTVHSPGFVAVKGDEIVEVGPAAQAEGIEAERRIDATGHYVLPGLINGHQHAPMTIMRGVADDLLLMDWLENYIFPAEAENVDPEMVYWGTLLSAMEMVSTGTTTYVDMYYFEDRVAEATALAGMRGILGQTILDFPVPDADEPLKGIEGARNFIVKWKGHPLITPAIAPHSAYTCSAETLLACKALAEELDVPLVIHVAESPGEVERVRESTGTTSVRFLNGIGMLSDRMIAAHTVWVDEEEMALLAASGVGAIHNPESNMKLAAGVAPVPDMLAAGVEVGVGTDGPASNNNLDLLQEIDTMAKLHKMHRKDPTVLDARTALLMATRLGAAAIDMDHLIGSLELGKKADLILVRSTRLPAAVPSYDPYSALVYALDGRAVETVVVNGQVIYQDGDLANVDEEAVYAMVEDLKRRLVESLR